MKKNKVNIIYLFFVLTLMFMTVGFAAYQKTVNINGRVNIRPNGKLEITNVELVTSEFQNVKQEYVVPTINDGVIYFSVTGSSTKFTSVYIFEVTNNSFFDQSLTAFKFNTYISSSENASVSPTITYVGTNTMFNPGDIISKGDTIRVKVKLEFQTKNSGTTVDVTGDTESTVDDTGDINATLVGSNLTGDLTAAGAIECYNLSIMNTFKYARNVNLVSSRDSIQLVNNVGNPLGTITVPENSTQQYEVCTKVTDGAAFVNDSVVVSIFASSGAINNINCGTITFAVEPEHIETDTIPPEIRNVSASITSVDPNTNTANVNVTWELFDTSGVQQTDVEKYYVLVCKDGGSCSQGNANGYSINNANITLSSEGTYTFKVYGIDELGHSGADTCNSNNNYCSFSSSDQYKWRYSVTTSLTNITYSGESYAYYLNDYTGSMTANGNRTLPGTIYVSIDGDSVTESEEFSYNQSAGTVTIYGSKITGNINISGMAFQCLVEGTKVRLANGKYKNIEDIKYDDLLEVYDHDNGGVTQVYPLWIEKEKITNVVTRIHFDDGSYIDTSSGHGFFSMDEMKYISSEAENFKIGISVAKVNDDGSIKSVKVTNIENLYVTKRYYQVSSTRYHNIIANDLITTDALIHASNMFKYDDKLTWNEDRNKLYANNDLFYWEDWKEYFPEHIWYGFRMNEAKNLMYQGVLDVPRYSEVLKVLVLDPPYDKNGNNLWMVTTSDDIILKPKDYLVKEGKYYTLKSPRKKNGFIGWYNTSDGKMYYPGDRVRVIYGIHFIAKYK